jgi:hypothetical protein
MGITSQDSRQDTSLHESLLTLTKFTFVFLTLDETSEELAG